MKQGNGDKWWAQHQRGVRCGETEDERGAPGNGNLRVKTWRHCRRKQRGHGGGRHSSQRELRRSRASLGLSNSGRRQEAEGGGERQTGAQGGGSGARAPCGRSTSPLLPMWTSWEGWSTGARCGEHSVKDCSGCWAADRLRKHKGRGSQWATAWPQSPGSVKHRF